MTADLSVLYRLAMLLMGQQEAARDVLVEALSQAHSEMSQFRDDRHRTAWVVGKLRERALKHAPPSPGGTGFAGEFARLEEPQRTALAIFYLDFMTIRDMARLLKMDIETLGETLERGRVELHVLLEGAGK